MSINFEYEGLRYYKFGVFIINKNFFADIFLKPVPDLIRGSKTAFRSESLGMEILERLFHGGSSRKKRSPRNLWRCTRPGVIRDSMIVMSAVEKERCKTRMRPSLPFLNTTVHLIHRFSISLYVLRISKKGDR